MAEKPKEQPAASRAGNGKTHRQPTPEELKIHEAEKPKILSAIRRNHAKTMAKVKAMQNNPVWIDRG